MNSSGLGLHFNILSHESDDDSGGVPVHAIARRILDEADTLEQAVQIAGSATVSASTSLTVIAGSAGATHAASVELSPEGMAVVPAGPDGWLLHDRPLPGRRTERRRHHAGRFHDGGAVLTPERGPARDPRPLNRRKGAGLHGPAGVESAVCMRPDPTKPAHEQWGTLLTISLDTLNCALDYATVDPGAGGAHRLHPLLTISTVPRRLSLIPAKEQP